MNHTTPLGVDGVFQRVKRRDFFVDTLKMHLPKRLTSRERKVLRPHCGGFEEPECKAADFQPRLQFSLVIQQPTDHCLALLDSLDSTSGKPVAAFHVAADFTTASRADADRLWDWMIRHETKPWPGKQRPRINNEATHYSGDSKRQRGKRIATYADRLSKITGEPCCHVELRFLNTAACRSAGIETASDLLNQPFRDFFLNPRNVKYQIVNTRKLGRQALGRSKAKTPLVDRFIDKELRTGGKIQRAAMYSAGASRVATQHVLNYCRDRGFSWFRPSCLDTFNASTIFSQ